MDNKEIYSNAELDSWIQREDLLVQEKYLLDKYIKEKDSKIIEAGTGGGRLSLYLYKKGFKNIMAFDFVPEMINIAKRKNCKIDFRIANATDLAMVESDSFDYAIYLQQIISLVPIEMIDQALYESYRVVKKDGIVIFSFLNYNGRKVNPLLSCIVNTFRFLRGERRDKYTLPWLKVGNKFNYKFFMGNQALIYWFTKENIVKRLRDIGFEIIEIKTSKDFAAGSSEGMLHIVSKK